MAEPRPNFLSAFRLKLAAWLRVVAARLEARVRTQDSMSPPRPSGPPAHWIERVQHAAPELLQPGPPNFRTPPPGDNTRHLPAIKPAPRPPAPASQTAGRVRAALRHLWSAVSRRKETPQRPQHEDKPAGTKAETLASYPATRPAQPAVGPRFPAAVRKSQPTTAALPQTAAPAPPRDEAGENQTVRAREREKRIPPIRLSPGPSLAQPARSVPRRDLSAEIGNLAQGQARPVANRRLTSIPETTCDALPDEPPEKAEVIGRKSEAGDLSDGRTYPVAGRLASESQSSPSYPPWSPTRMARPVMGHAGYPPATTPIPVVPRAAERESFERWPALPTAAEAETREDWRAWQREEQHRARLVLEQQGLPWTA